MPDDRLTGSMQESLLTCLAFSEDKRVSVLETIDPKHFEPPYDDLASRIIEFRHRFKEPPGRSHIDDVFDHVLGNPSDRRHQLYSRLLTGMIEQAEGINVEYVVKRVRDFVRRQKLKAAIIEAGHLYESQATKDTLADDVEAILAAALRDKLDDYDVGTFMDQEKALAFLEQNENDFMPMGIPEMDRRLICPVRKELLLFVAPRKAGKCVAADELVQLPDGSRKRIEDVVRDKDKCVIALDEITGEFVKAKVSDHWDNGVKPVVRVVTRTGRIISTTQNHQYLTPFGWKLLSDLRVGDFIAVPLKLSNLGSDEVDPHLVRLLGYLIADGSLRDIDTTFTKKDKRIRGDFVECVRAIGDEVTERKDFFYVVANPRWGNSETRRLLSLWGLANKKSKKKFVPEWVFKLSDEQIGLFLRSLFSCDGYIYADNRTIEYTSASRRLTMDIQHLLMRLGIVARYDEFEALFEGRKLPGYGRLSISGKTNVLAFLDKVGWFREGAEERIAEVRKHFEDKNPKFNYGCRPCNEMVFYDGIDKVENLPSVRTYDLTIPKYHNFVASDAVVHNTWFCVNLVKQAAVRRWKVLYVSLEISERIFMQRLYQSFFAVAKRGDEYKRMVMELDNDRGHMINLNVIDRKPKWHLEHPKIEKYLREHMVKQGLRLHSVLVKQFPTNRLTVRKFEAYLDQLEALENFIPDLVILDYPDLMDYDLRNPVIALGKVYEDFRGVLVERNMAGVAPTQGTREAEDVKKLKTKHVSRDISKIATCDNAIFYNATGAEKQFGLARLSSIARNDEAVDVLIEQDYMTGQFCLRSSRLKESLYWDIFEDLSGKEGHVQDDD